MIYMLKSGLCNKLCDGVLQMEFQAAIGQDKVADFSDLRPCPSTIN
jgi:hypothetical protein